MELKAHFRDLLEGICNNCMQLLANNSTIFSLIFGKHNNCRKFTWQIIGNEVQYSVTFTSSMLFWHDLCNTQADHKCPFLFISGLWLSITVHMKMWMLPMYTFHQEQKYRCSPEFKHNLPYGLLWSKARQWWIGFQFRVDQSLWFPPWPGAKHLSILLYSYIIMWSGNLFKFGQTSRRRFQPVLQKKII